MTTEEWKRVIDEASDIGVLHVSFSGGEPLLFKDLPELVQTARQAGLYTNLITSAIGWQRTRAQQLLDAGLAPLGGPRDAEPLVYALDQKVMAGKTQQYVDIVVVTMLSGDSSSVEIGEDVLRGIALAQQEYDNPLPSIPVRLLIANVGANSSYAPEIKQQIEQLYQTDSHLVGILGWPVSADPRVIQAIEDLAQTGLPIISPTATADELDHHTNLYLMAPLNKVQARAHVELVKKAFSDAHPNEQTRPIKVVMLETQISTNIPSPYSQSLIRGFSDTSHSAPIQIVDTLKYVRGNKLEIQTAVDKAVREGADIIYLPGYAEDANIALQELGKDDPQNSIKVVGGDALAHFIAFPFTQYPSSSYQRLYYTSFSVPQTNCNTNADNFYTHFYSIFGAFQIMMR